MTPLDKLAAQKRTPGQMWATAEDIAVDEALIAVARAARATKIRCRCTDYKSCEECVLINARDALDSAITKELGK